MRLAACSRSTGNFRCLRCLQPAPVHSTKKGAGGRHCLAAVQEIVIDGWLVYCVLSFRPFSSSCSRPGRPRRPQPTSPCLYSLLRVILSRSVVVPSLNCCGCDIRLYPLRTPSPAELLPRPNFCQLSSNCSTLYPRPSSPGSGTADSLLQHLRRAYDTSQTLGTESTVLDPRDGPLTTVGGRATVLVKAFLLLGIEAILLLNVLTIGPLP